MRKCAQCGKDIPTGNSSCNYCGYNPGEMNKKSSYSFGKVTNGPKVNLNVNGSKTGKIILIIFLCMFFAPFILGIIMMTVMGILFSTDIFEDESFKSCNTLCSGEYHHVGDYCYCDDGIIYDEDGNEIFEEEYGDLDFGVGSENVHLFETNTLNLDRYVNNNEDVVVVVCSGLNPLCNDYIIRMMDLASSDEFNLFIYKYDLLDEEQQTNLLKYYLGVYDETKPLTFIISNGKMKCYHEENMTRSEIRTYLIDKGIIVE